MEKKNYYNLPCKAVKELLHTDTIERIFSVHRYRATDESGIEHLFFSSI